MEKDYRELLRDRTEKAARPARETKVIELEETNRLDAVGMQIGRMDDGFTKAKKAAPRDVNVRAEDLGALRSQILASFFHHEYASLDYLAEKLKQPKAFFKEQLQQFAQQERSGPYNGMWRLKPEYREFLDAQAKSAGGDIEADGGEAKGVDSEDMGDDDEDIDEEMADA